MPGAIIHIDLDYLLPVPPDILLVEHVSDYPAAYLRLRETFHTSASMSLWIRDRTVATWFSRVAATYGDAYITLHYHTAKRAL